MASLEDLASILPRTQETFVQYEIHASASASAPARADRAALQVIATECLEFVKPWADAYMWQRDPFWLGVHADGTHVEGRTRFGDNIEDEWFIVWLLLRITEHFPTLAVRVTDDDGEFLLVEAAVAIDERLTPLNSAQRVWLHGGRLHIIPLDVTPRVESASGALALLGEHTEASTAVWDVVQRRVVGMPARALQQSTHHVRVVVPARVAHVLEHAPQLLAHAVETFYAREPRDVAAASRMAALGTAEPVTARVRFTRCLYAQLAGANFHPPKWCTLPPADAAEHAAHAMGMRVACALEMVHARGSEVTTRFRARAVQARAIGATAAADVALDPGWRDYAAVLASKGFFQGEIEGSQRYQQLLARAQAFYARKYLQAGVRPAAVPVARVIDGVVAHVPMDVRALRTRGEDTAPSDDAAEWIRRGAAAVDSIVSEREREAFGRGGGDGSDTEDAHGGGAAVLHMERVVERMSAFVDNVSSHEGAEAPRDQGVQFDADRFVHVLRHALGDTTGDSAPADREDEPDEFYAMGADSDDDDDGDDGDDDGGDVAASHEVDGDMQQLVAAMDAELASTTLAKSFATADSGSAAGEDASAPVDVNLNLVKNLLESFSSQAGLAGPVSNLLGELGVPLPDNDE